MKIQFKTPLWGKRRKRLEALAMLATVNVPKRTSECTRCGVVAFDDESRALAVAGHLVNSTLNSVSSILLCGRCNLILIEFLFPHRVGDPTWEKYKHDKWEKWG